MPVKSPRQFGAMLAAAKGQGTRGIPQRVAQEFLRETPRSKKQEFGRALASRAREKKSGA